jgi:hypothetical protein
VSSLRRCPHSSSAPTLSRSPTERKGNWKSGLTRTCNPALPAYPNKMGI